MRDSLITAVGVVGCVLLVVGFGWIGEGLLALVARVIGGASTRGASSALNGLVCSAVGFLVIATWAQLRRAASRGRDPGRG